MSLPVLIKKLIFIFPFYACLFGFVFFLNFFLQNPAKVLSLNYEVLIKTGWLIAFLLLTSLFFVIFTVLANNWKLIIPATFISPLPLMIFQPSFFFLFLVPGFILIFLFIYLSLNRTLSSYLDFQPSRLLSPAVRQSSIFLLILVSAVFYLSLNNHVQQNGFKVPSSLIDLILNQMPLNSLDPSLLDQLGNINQNQSQNLKFQTPNLQSLLKPAVEQQLQNLLNPYLQFIAPLLTLFFFLSLSSLVGIVSPLVSFLLWLIFVVLEKTGFIHFQSEMREVKKLVV